MVSPGALVVITCTVNLMRGKKNARTVKVAKRKETNERKLTVKSIVVRQLGEAGITVLREARGERTDISSRLPALSNPELRRAQLADPCLGSVTELKEKNPARPPWEEDSLKSPIFKSRYYVDAVDHVSLDRRCAVPEMRVGALRFLGN